MLMLQSYGVGGGSVSSGPFLSYEIEIGDGTGPELDNFPMQSCCNLGT